MIPFTVSSPNFGLADQAGDPWGGGCVTISGPKEVEAREWYRKQNMPVVAYSSLAHGLLAGKVKSTDLERVAELLDAPTIKGYGSEENFERLRRCEILAAEKQATVAQIAMAYIFHQDLNVFAVVSASKPEPDEREYRSASDSVDERRGGVAGSAQGKAIKIKVVMVRE